MNEKIETLSIRICRENSNKVFVFGDNLMRRGKKGQAVIRDIPNTFGIPTKRAPNMNDNAFFSDKLDEIALVFRALSRLKNLEIAGKTIVFPASGLGTGLARMEEKSPILFKLMNEAIHREFGVKL